MKDKKYSTEITEKLWFAMLLAATGGFMDMYSYVVHGNVFATGQTGNFVLVAVHLIEKDYMGAFHCVIPIISFWIGIFIAWHMFYSYFKEKQLLWKQSIIAAEIIIVFIAGFIPLSCLDIIANTLVSFAASLQFCAFRKLGTSENYASIFCTGNMRSCAENYYKGIARKDKQCLKKALRYSIILVSFFVGAIISALEAGFLHQKAIWSVDVILLLALIASFVLNARMLRNSLEDEEILEERVG